MKDDKITFHAMLSYPQNVFYDDKEYHHRKRNRILLKE